MSTLNNLSKKDQEMLTKQQKASIETDGKVIVSASAGSGKSTTMVLKILSLIAEGKHLKDMLIVVYNDSAANELKQKIRDKLIDRIGDDSLEEKIRDKFAEELRGMEFCQISTIHAFCRNLAKEKFEILGISPQFDILDEQKDAKLKDIALNKVFNSYDAKDEVFSDILEIFASQRKDENLKNNLLNIYATYNIQPDKVGFNKQISDCYDCKFEDSYFINYTYEYYMKTLEVLLVELKKAQSYLLMNKYQDTYREGANYYVEKIEYMLRSKDLFNLAYAFKEYPNFDGKMTLKTSSPTKDEDSRYTKIVKYVRDEVNEIGSKLVSLYDERPMYEKAHIQNGLYIHKIIEILDCFEKEYKDLKAKENAYTFDDLLHFAIELIKADNAGNILEKYEYVFVDECQDITPLTDYILSYFMKQNTYVVGDVKQSIYGFNLADPDLFLSRQAKYKSGDGVAIDFNTNFRSKNAILSFANDVFSSIMTEKSAQINYLKDAQFDLKDDNKGGEVEVSIFINKDEKQKIELDEVYDITKDDVAEEEFDSSAYVEGKYIAHKIKKLIDEKSIVNDSETGLRPITYSDIVVLFRSRCIEANKIIESLRKEGIPVDDSSFSTKKTNPEHDLMSFLHVIDNPRQDEYLVGYLLSFFGGYDEKELWTIANEYKGFDFYDKFVQCANGDAPLSKKAFNTLDVLEEYRVKACFKNVTDLMNGIIADYSYDAYLMRNSLSDVNALKTFILSKANKKEETLSAFINEYSTNEKIPGSPTISNSVKVTTFHAFKGLESPVVFVANISRRFNTQELTQNLLFTGNGNIALRYFDLENKNKYQSLSYSVLNCMLLEKAKREEMRLLYVALTRAKEKMFITGTAANDLSADMPPILSASSNLEFLRQAAYYNNGKTRINYINYEYEKSEDVIDVETKIDEDFGKQIEKVQSYVYPYLNSTKLGMKYGVSSLIDDGEGTQYMFESKADIGTCYHKVMQHISFDITTIEGVEEEYQRFVDEKIMDESELENVDKVLILQCLNQDFIKNALKLEKDNETRREEKFTMYVEANKVSNNVEFTSNDKVLVQGVVDLYIGGDDPMIVDFKYSNLDHIESIERYSKQLNLYRIAMEGATGKKINKLVLYSFKTGRCIEIPCED